MLSILEHETQFSMSVKGILILLYCISSSSSSYIMRLNNNYTQDLWILEQSEQIIFICYLAMNIDIMIMCYFYYIARHAPNQWGMGVMSKHQDFCAISKLNITHSDIIHMHLPG